MGAKDDVCALNMRCDPLLKKNVCLVFLNTVPPTYNFNEERSEKGSSVFIGR